MAAKGCDGMLFPLAEDLPAAGIVAVSKTGYSGVNGGDFLPKKRSLRFEQCGRSYAES
jgi:hypothetical protein